MRALDLVFVLALVGCDVGHLVRPDQPLVLGSDTVFALAVHSNEYVTLTFCRDADYSACVTTGQLPREHPVQLYQVPPGRYCLLEMLVDPYTGSLGSIHVEIPPERSVCFVAHADVIAYPGDLEITSAPSEGIYWTVHPHWSWPTDIDQRIYAQYPDLRSRPVQESRPMPYGMQR